MKNPPKRKSVKAANLNNATKSSKKEEKTIPAVLVIDQTQDSAKDNNTSATIENESKTNDNIENISSKETTEAEQSIHPLSCHLIVRYRDQSHRIAKVIEKSFVAESTGNKVWKYYIHYIDFNRRMDEWIGDDRIISGPEEAEVLYKLHKAKHGHHSHHGNIKHLENEDENGEETSQPKKRIKLEHPVDSEYTTVAELEHDEHEGLDEASIIEHEEVTKVKNFLYVQLGQHIMECWYFSPLPKEYHLCPPVQCIYFCEFTFRLFKTKQEMIRFQSNPSLPRHPPGNEIYRDANLAMFEIDGLFEKTYCQNLAFFAKFFLDHKTLYWDVDPFLFYVLCSYDSYGYHPVGYFSKEKVSDMGYNLACILTFPSAQRKGYGKFLINFSYELSKKEEKVGSPEKPLSDLGAVSYRSYWASILVRILRNYSEESLSIMDLSRLTAFLSDDIISTLHYLGLLQEIEGEFMIYGPDSVLDKLIEKYPMHEYQVDPDRLLWAPMYNTDAKKDRWSLKSKVMPSSTAAIDSSQVSTLTTTSSIPSTTGNS